MSQVQTDPALRVIGAERGITVKVMDGVALAVVSLVALSPLGDAFGGGRWLVAASAGLLLALGLTYLGARWRWGPMITMLAALVGCVLVAPGAALPHQALAQVLPSLAAERMLFVGAVQSWRDVLTLPTPLGSSNGELLVPFLTALVGGVIAATLVVRTRFAGAAAVPVLAMFLVAATMGDADARGASVRGLVLVVVLVGWLRWRSIQASAASWGRRVMAAVLLVGLSGSLAWGATAVLGSGEREVLRDHVEPPMAQLDLRSPLARFRDYYLRHKDDVLFTFEGLPSGKPYISLATMDSYDGLVWNVSATDLATGTSAFRPAGYDGSGDVLTVTVGEYAGTWVPTVGTATGAASDGGAGERQVLMNAATGAVAVYGEVRAGDRYRITWTPRGRRADDLARVEADRTVAAPRLTSPPIEKLTQLAQRVITKAGARSDFDRAVAIEGFFRDQGYFNDGDDPVRRDYSVSGHGLRRLGDLVADERRMIGNEEQYAAAMGYALQSLGIPARVVLGFEGANAQGAVTGGDIAAWVEVPFTGRGWVAFDPTPDEDRIPPPTSDDPNPKPQPYVVQPPVLPVEPADVQGTPPEGAGQDLGGRVWAVLGAVLAALWTGVKAALWLSPLWGIVVLKAVRRRRRRRAADPVLRVSGAWREITDQARDLGVRVSAGRTRQENGILLAERFAAAAPAELAATADRHVFGPGQPDEAEVAAYWADVETAAKRMRRATAWWRRTLAWFSPFSLPWHEARRAVGTARSRAQDLRGRLRVPRFGRKS